MKTTLTYSARMTICVHTLGLTANIDMGCKELQEVLDYVEAIFNDDTMFRKYCVSNVHVIDSNTGELIAICDPDQPIGDDPD